MSKRSVSTARAKPSTPPLFESELRQLFDLLRIGSDRVQEGLAHDESGQLSALEFARTQLHLGLPVGREKRGAQRNSASEPPVPPGAPKSHIAAHKGADYLKVLREAQFPVADAGGLRALSFAAFCAWQRTLLQNAGRSFAARKQLLVNAIAELEGRVDSLRKRDALNDASTVSALRQAIRAAVPVLGRQDRELISHQERLTAMEAPFVVKVSTLVGEQHELEVTRGQTVGDFRSAAASLLGKKPYRVLLACQSSSLSPDDATLEACGLTTRGIDVSAVFKNIDPWREMPISEFLELAMQHEFVSVQEASKIRARLNEGSFSEEQCITRYAPLLQIKVDLEAGKLAWKQAEEAEQDRFQTLRALKPSDEATVSGQELIEISEAYASQIEYFQQVCDEGTELFSELTKAMSDARLSAQADLDIALPALEQSVRALEHLEKRDIMEIKSFAKPPLIVTRVMEAVCVLMCANSKCSVGKDPEGFWRMVKTQILNDCRLLQKMLNFDKDNIDPDTICRLQPFITSGEFQPDSVQRVSIAAAAFCRWVHAMHTYHHVAEKVWPQRLLLRSGTERLKLIEALNQGRASRLHMLQTDVAELQAKLCSLGPMHLHMPVPVVVE